ncbi:MAG: His/Gly/Thr/Pro-type tRNA ligase C-terminal domain-containing protein, partial [Armatimonadota bacterium]|nr:His/Gly/Thr/Pro-type tRNA ligase C-terminal domain-containing protein [Armatimonadota bacterium]
GFGIGLERVMAVLEKLGVELPVDTSIEVFVASVGEAARREAVKLVYELRSVGISTDTDYTNRSLKSQMKLADRLGAKLVIILGEAEVASRTAILRDMSTSHQVEVSLPNVSAAISEQLYKESGKTYSNV